MTGLGITICVELGPRFFCFVCREPIELEARPKLLVDAGEAFVDLQSGKKPKICCSCGREWNFRRKSAAFRRYLQFLSMHLPEDWMVDELEKIA